MDGDAPPSKVQKKRKDRQQDAATLPETLEKQKPRAKKSRHHENTETADAPAPRVSAAKPAKAAAARPRLAALSSDEQAAALLASYVAECGAASFIEEEAFKSECVLAFSPKQPSLEAKLKTATPKWKDTLARAPHDVPTGSPVVLIIAGAALRVIEIIKALPDFRRGCQIPKLFSKHMKLEEHVQLLSNARIAFGVGTPARLDKLLAIDALHLDRVSLILIDCSRDVKLRSMLDIPETRKDFWQLWRTHLAKRVTDGLAKVALID